MRGTLEDRQTFFARCRPDSGFKTIYTAKGGEVISYINVANVNETESEWSACVAQGSEKYGKKNALVWAETLSANDNDVWGYGIPLSQGMRIGVRSSSAGALNFTIYGVFGN